MFDQATADRLAATRSAAATAYTAVNHLRDLLIKSLFGAPAYEVVVAEEKRLLLAWQVAEQAEQAYFNQCNADFATRQTAFDADAYERQQRSIGHLQAA